ncbi:MAG TPA: alcohol dehydrogenase catalytic domain-containing protein [Chloroflexota bacterium]|nr:alcohol dehydrogenase catalytic domain-containing protein [Chloroflexota bacterium]
MKALLKVAPEPGALELRDVPRPTPRADEVIVEVAGASICGSDLHIAQWHPMAQWTRTPVILGHEFAGVVTDVGAAAGGFRPGDAVAVESVIWCGRCPPCRAGRTNVCDARRLFGIHEPGGLAEAVAVPSRLLHRLPASLPPRHAALAEPTTVALHAVLLQPPQPGDVVLVTGPGPIGLLAGRAARAFGARVLIAGTPADAATRLPAARKLGLEPLDPAHSLADALAAVTDAPVDLVLECSGAAAAIDAALHVVKRGGGVTLIGMPSATVEIDLTLALRGEVSLRPSYFGTWHDFERAIALIASGTIPAEELLVAYTLDNVLAAFADAEAQRVLKPVVHP